MSRQQATWSRWNLPVNFQRQASLRSGSTESRATADGSSSNCSFSFTTADSTFSHAARGGSHHGRTTITQIPETTVRSSSLSRNKRCGGDLVVLGTRLLKGNAHGCCLLNLREGEEQKEVLEAQDDEEKKVKWMEKSTRESLNVCMRHDE